MKHLLLITVLLFISCHSDTELFDKITSLAGFGKKYKLTLIQNASEGGFLEPIAEYAIYRMDSLDFQELENAVLISDRFYQGTFYFNDELNDFIYNNELQIQNMSKCLITANKYDEVYYLYLLSDKQTIAVCKVKR